jgi:hypothetical protein
MGGIGVARKQHAGAVAFPSWVKQAAVGAAPARLVEFSGSDQLKCRKCCLLRCFFGVRATLTDTANRKPQIR